MLPIAHVGIAPPQLAEMVEGEVWDRWVSAEPELAAVGSLAELNALRASATDGPLGALVRLAAADGGDEELAGIAVVHQLEAGVQRLVCEFRNLTEDIEAVVIGALWEEIRTFPWRRRTRSYAANLLYDTRRGVTATLLPGTTRRGPEPVVLIDPQSQLMNALTERRTTGWRESLDDAAAELAELLGWAVTAGVVTDAQARLLVELVTADRVARDPRSPNSARGACSVAAATRVAERHGLCRKTVFRQRDKAIRRLREAADRYLVEAA
jgi:hypothetical protein